MMPRGGILFASSLSFSVDVFETMSFMHLSLLEALISAGLATVLGV